MGFLSFPSVFLFFLLLFFFFSSFSFSSPPFLFFLENDKEDDKEKEEEEEEEDGGRRKEEGGVNPFSPKDSSTRFWKDGFIVGPDSPPTWPQYMLPGSETTRSRPLIHVKTIHLPLRNRVCAAGAICTSNSPLSESDRGECKYSFGAPTVPRGTPTRTTPLIYHMELSKN